jgi:uncharacterized protein (TIGR04255 family)
MNLPKQITPNPITSAIMEVRFTSKQLTPDNFLKLFYPILIKKFDKMTENKVMPFAVNGNSQQLNFISQYIFSNDEFSVGVSPNSLTIGVVDQYPLWSTFFDVIKETLSSVNSIVSIDKIFRVGLRYVSIFQGVQGIEGNLDINPTFNFDNYEGYMQQSSTVYTKGNIQLVLNLGKEIVGQNQITGAIIKGLYVDIDSSSSNSDSISFDERLFDQIDSLHTQEKALFFSLLKNDFLNSLNPTYA